MKALLFCMFASFFAKVSSVEIPPELHKVCDREEPDLNDCIKEALQISLRNLANGLPKFGMKSLDPHFEKELIIEYQQNQIYGKAIVRNIKVYGLSHCVVHRVRANLQDDFMKLEADMSNKKIVVIADFHGEGRLNAFTFSTNTGAVNNTMSDVTWTWKLTGEPENKNGTIYMKIKKFSMRPEVGNMIVKMKDIFPDNPGLVRIASDFAQIYWKTIYHELLPIVEQAWDKLGVKISNKIFLRIPYDDLFPTSF